MTRLLLVCISLLLAGCGETCRNEVVQEVVSPDGQNKAVIFQRDCGATSSFTTQVSVLRRNETLSGSGNVFVADDNHGLVEVGDWGGPWVGVRWSGSEHLQVIYAKGARIYHQVENVGAITVSFRTRDHTS